MQEIIEKALKKGVAMQEAGDLNLASQFFETVISLQPHNPDANHNLGMLAVSVGKVQEAVPFLKTALEADPNRVQFWLSYIDVLIKLDCCEDAKALLDKARSKGAKGPGFDELKNRLQKAGKSPREANQLLAEPKTQQPNILDSLKLDQAIKLAKKKANAGFPEEAKGIYRDILTRFPKNKRASEGLSRLVVGPIRKSSNVQEPPHEEQQTLINLFSAGQLHQALQETRGLIEKYPRSAFLFNIQGAILKELGHLEQSIEAYKQALAIKPDYAEARNNMGVTLEEKGKLKKAIEAYYKALDIQPDYAEAAENFQSLATQLLPILYNYVDDCNTNCRQVKSEIFLRPKYQIQMAIKNFLQADFSEALSHINNFTASDQKLLGDLPPKDHAFCFAYSDFLGKLLDANWNEESASDNEIYHLGESHCLSYAHRNITIDGSIFRINPRITFGAKAFHFSASKQNTYKSITQAHLSSLPKYSKVFLSYGEIDCRSNEGFIAAARKLDKPLKELINQTTQGFVRWFSDQNIGQQHHLYFINVPAPVYDKKHSNEINAEVASTVAMFNTALKKCTFQLGFDMVNVFQFTADEEGFSNGFFHVDNFHLGAKALPEIERQLT